MVPPRIGPRMGFFARRVQWGGDGPCPGCPSCGVDALAKKQPCAGHPARARAAPLERFSFERFVKSRAGRMAEGRRGARVGSPSAELGWAGRRDASPARAGRKKNAPLLRRCGGAGRVPHAGRRAALWGHPAGTPGSRCVSAHRPSAGAAGTDSVPLLADGAPCCGVRLESVIKRAVILP